MYKRQGRQSLDDDYFDTGEFGFNREERTRLAIQHNASMHFRRIFCGKVPSLYHKIVEGGNEIVDMPYLAGQFVGVRRDSGAARVLHREYMRHGSSDAFAGDEGFFFYILHKFPELQICNVFYPPGECLEGMIKNAHISNTFPNEGQNMDIGDITFWDDKYHSNHEFLIDYFRGMINLSLIHI